MHRPARRLRCLLRASPPIARPALDLNPPAPPSGPAARSDSAPPRSPPVPRTPPPSGLAVQGRPDRLVLRARARVDHRSISCPLAAGHRGIVGATSRRRHGRVDAVGDQRSCKEADKAPAAIDPATWSQLGGGRPPSPRRPAGFIARQGRSRMPATGNCSPDGRPALPATPRARRYLGHGPPRAQNRPLGTLIGGNQPHRGARLLKMSRSTACTPCQPLKICSRRIRSTVF